MTQYVNNSGADLYVRSEDGPDVEVKAGETVDLPEADYGSSLVLVDSTAPATPPKAPAPSVPVAAATPPAPVTTTEPSADAPAPAEPTQEKAQ